MNEQSDKPLFETKTELTWEEYRKFYAAVRRNGLLMKIARAAVLAASAAGALICVYSLLIGAPPRFAFYLAAYLALAAAILIFPTLQARAAYKRLTALGGDTATEMSFYEDRLASRCGENERVVPYADIYKVIETSDNFYIMIANVQGFIVAKDNCSGELLRFIRGLGDRLGELVNAPEPELPAPETDETEETPAYETKTVMDWEEYRRYNTFVYRRQPKYIVLWFLSIALLVFGFAFSRYIGPICMVLAVIAMAELLLVPWMSGRAYYKSSRYSQNVELTVRFYGDRLERVGGGATDVIRYDRIYRLYETKTNFYIMQSSNFGVVIVKTNCSPELTDFIRGLKEKH